MDFNTGRPNHIDDYIRTIKSGQWFGWYEGGTKEGAWCDDTKMTYANLTILDGSTKPSEAEINAGLKAMQDAWDAQEYARNRANEYPEFSQQFDDIYHNGIDGWKASIKAIKDKYPKS
tara:strand:+ start:56 stop:409 length:354 start_codon:yes stop_codon:yes gene_type:complete